jgi:uncharacterized protein
MKPIYFDLTVTDLNAARGFFEQALGWKFERFPMPYEYYRITAGAPGEPGIDGGIGGLGGADASSGRPTVTLTIPVQDLDQMLSKVKESGGKFIEPRMPIPGIGWYATCAEPGGLMFGVMQADAEAK